MLSERSILADINVWIATMLAEHPHHRSVTSWWTNEVLPSENVVAFCRLTQLGLLRLLTNDKVMGKEKRTHLQAWQNYLQLLSQSSVIFMEEPEGIENVLEAHCKLGGSSPNFWTDAYLAAFAKTSDSTFATFDRGFRKFPGLQLDLLP